MKIAVPFDNGNVFQHFGKAEEFVIYTVEDQQVTCIDRLQAAGEGHEAMAQLLKENGVDVVVAGNMGEHAKEALSAAGIEAVTGAAGSTDAAAVAYITSQLDGEQDDASGCGCGGDCGTEESEGCGGGCSSCGGGCGGCGGGCGAPQIYLEGPNAGKNVAVHYTGTFNDGTKFDSSYDRGEPLEFICGAGMMISGFDKAVVDMEVGQTVDIHLMPEEAYGLRDENKIIRLEHGTVEGTEDLELGQKVTLYNNYGQGFYCVVIEKNDEAVVLDANHEMAGKELNFKIELVSVN